MTQVAIYALLDESGTVRYVGKANDAAKRLLSHLRDMRRRNTPLYAWLRKRVVEGFLPTIQVLEVCDSAVWTEREKHWIAEYRRNGKLLNLANGGDEPFCPPTVRAANGRKVAKKRWTLEERELFTIKTQLGQALRAGECSEELKAKIRHGIAVRPGVFGCLAKYLSINNQSKSNGE